MSYLAGEGLDDDILGSPGAQSYARGAIIGAGARAGESGASVLGSLRAFGLGLRTQDFYDVWRAISAQIATSQTASALNVDANTGQIMPGGAPANWTGQYVHQVTATFRTRDDQGNYELAQRTLGIKSVNTLSPFEASQAALGILEAPVDEEDEGGYGESGDLMSLQLTGAWYDTSPGVLRVPGGRA